MAAQQRYQVFFLKTSGGPTDDKLVELDWKAWAYSAEFVFWELSLPAFKACPDKASVPSCLSLRFETKLGLNLLHHARPGEMGRAV